MSQTAPRHVDVHVGDVSDSQLVIGDHTVVQTAAGARITVVAAGDAPVPRLRPVPFARRPLLRDALLGREGELGLAARASAQEPLQLFGPEGVGKTTLLKAIAHQATTAPEGVVFIRARRRQLDEILLALYTECFECEIPFVPNPAQLPGYLSDRRALVLVDDCALDRDDLEALADAAPECRFVFGSPERTLLAFGHAQRLPGLAEVDALALLGRQLGRPLTDAERQAAVLIATGVAGHPQRLIEIAQLVAEGVSTLTALADLTPAETERLNADTLSAGQRRILALLAGLDGAALGSPHIAALTGVADAEATLSGLEARGLIRPGSPRYRLSAGPACTGAPAGRGVPVSAELEAELLHQLLDVARRTDAPAAVAEEAEAIEALLARLVFQRRWPEALRLARAAEPALARAGAWVSWRRVLLAGRDAAQALPDRRAEAHMHHQLGSVAACLGERARAREELLIALELRVADGDDAGAELTRHNLGQLGGGGEDPGGGTGPPRPRRGAALLLAVAGLAVLLLVAVAVLTHGGTPRATRAGALAATAARTSPRRSTRAASSGAHPTTGRTGPSTRAARHATTSTASTAPAPAPPAVSIATPVNDSTITAGTPVTAHYTCTAGRAPAARCTGPVPDGTPITTTKPGTYAFTVTAVNRAGQATSRTVTYTVTSADTTPPVITISSPKNGGTYGAGTQVPVVYSCADAPGGSGVATCDGTVPNGSTITVSPSGGSVTVTASDRAGNTSTATASYSSTAPIH